MSWWNQILSTKYLADWKDAVRAATAAALPAYTLTNNVMRFDAVGAMPTVDGVALAVGDAFLLKQGSHANNGIYVVDHLGSGSSRVECHRRDDFDEDSDVHAGLCVRVAEGATYGGEILYLTTTGAVVLNQTALTFAVDTAPGIPNGSAAGQVPVWNGAAWVAGEVDLADGDAVGGLLPVTHIAIGAANTVLRTDSGATAAEWAKLTTANLDVAAGILAAQLASGAAGTVLAGGAPNAWTATPTITSAVCGVNADAGLSVTATALTVGKDVVAFALTQATHATTPQTLTVRAANVTTGIGSTLALNSGTGSTSDGAVQLQVGGETLVEACEVAAGRRVVSLCRAAALTTTQMGANTGDGVIYVANAATVPTSAAAAGNILWSTSGVITTAANFAVKGMSGITDSPAVRVDNIAGTARVKVQWDSGASLGYVGTETGHGFALLTGNTARMYLDTSGNAALFAAGSYGGGVKVLFVGDRTTAPTSAPSGGYLAYAESGGARLFAADLHFHNLVSAPLISQLAPITDVATVDTTIAAQSARAANSTNLVGGTLILQGGAKATAGVAADTGFVRLATGEGAAVIDVGYFGGALCQMQWGVIAWAETIAPQLTIFQRQGDNGTHVFEISGQAASASATGSNENGGRVYIHGGARDGSTANHGGVRLGTGAGAAVVEVADNNGTAQLGLFGTASAAQQTVSGSRGGNAALQSLCTALANYGLIIDSTS
jgi:hypothetical protein